MAGITAKELSRIEDFIELANEGKDVRATINLRKQKVSQNVHPNETSGGEDTVEMYLLSADFTFRTGNLEKVVSKPYIYASSEESLSASRINKSIANERLKLDYRRLKSANIQFEGKYF
ncbi:MAG: hypothetical protein M0033_02425 [Nitrospiraceae bacterium]|nr:hypothetical protein [Nitrospiraceae bacterium]MDA8325054.1 hypothetical protein [Nitrospiraceae bacterium]